MSGRIEMSDNCNWPNAHDQIAQYCLGESPEHVRSGFEDHLVSCPSCWQEVRRLDTLLDSLRQQRELSPRLQSDVVAEIGLSSRLFRQNGGHTLHVWAASALHAAMIAASAVMEVAYVFDEYETFVFTVAPLLFCMVLVSTVLALRADLRVTRTGRQWGLAASVSMLILITLLNYAAVHRFLPNYPVTQATFQTWTAQAAYLKGLVYCASFTVVFLLVPFHLVLRLQREVARGRWSDVWEVLVGGRHAVRPPWTVHVRPTVLTILLGVGALYSLLSTAHLLEALKLTVHTNLFIHVIQIRWLLFLCLGGLCNWWYASALNELKRECRVYEAATSAGR